jgi:L-lactate dehydrogenase complex protein LldG
MVVAHPRIGWITMSARNEILDRIRGALGAADPRPIPRDYDRTPLDGVGDVDEFARTVDEYRATVYRTDDAGVAGVITGLVAHHDTVVIAPDFAEAWQPLRDVVRDISPDPLTVDALDAIGAVVTGCRLAIAATGTIVLDGGPGQGRRVLTLIPDHHVCIVRADQIVDTVPQAFAALDPTAPLTFISGPSATSDIELNRVEGVHGPRTLDVVIVG